MINIISTFYISKYSSWLDEQRTDELVCVLEKNMNSDFVENMYLFVDDNDALEKLNKIKNQKVQVIEIKKQPVISDFFNYILNRQHTGKSNKIFMISNSDIYLHSCDGRVLNLLNENKYVYAVSRHEWDMSCPVFEPNYLGSHDSYIFNSKFLDHKIINEHTKYKQNSPGIETRVISTFHESGFEVFNPCKQIKIVHLHKSELRNYGTSNWVGVFDINQSGAFRDIAWGKPYFVPPVEL